MLEFVLFYLFAFVVVGAIICAADKFFDRPK